MSEKQLKQPSSKKQKISKYDLIKIKIIIGNHFFIFSRYILLNILQVIGLSKKISNQISYDLKKRLVELNLTEISLEDFQKNLFYIFNDCNLTDVFKEKYFMINKFYSKRIPLIILISGSVLIGKSKISNAISEKMNISNVLQTKIVSIVMSGLSKNYIFQPFWKFSDRSIEDCLGEYERQSKIIRKGCSLDIIKAFKEGKSVILEGSHIVPKYFLNKENDQTIISLPDYDEEVTNNDEILRKEINQIKEIEGLIVPILLKTDETSHKRYIQKINNNKDVNDYEFRVFRRLQEYLIQNNNYFLEVDVEFNKESECVDRIHSIIIQKIEDYYKAGGF